MLTSLEVMSETSPSLPDLLQVEDADERAPAKRDPPLQTAVMRDVPFRMSSSEMQTIPITLLAVFVHM